MQQAPVPEGLPPSLRFLKALVTVLTLTLIGGVITITALIVTRMPQAMGAGPVLPAEIALPEGATARAVTFGTGWIAVVTTDNRILILDAGTGALRQEMAILPGG